MSEDQVGWQGYAGDLKVERDPNYVEVDGKLVHKNSLPDVPEFLKPQALAIEGTDWLAPPRPPEREIYEEMWRHDVYRAVAPGEEAAQKFLQHASPKIGATVLDFGCGTGRGGLQLAVLGQMNVTMLDFAANCLDEDIPPILAAQSHTIRFRQHDLTQPIPLELSAQYGFCTDVMEHIPPDDVDKVLNNILLSAQHCYFQIALAPDDHGEREIGHKLHLTVRPIGWWMQKFLDRKAQILFCEEKGPWATIYVNAWTEGKEFTNGDINVEMEEVRANVKHNIAQGYQQIQPYMPNDMEVIILGGSPSLNDHIETIKQIRAAGAKLITLNGAYNWAIEHGMRPSAQIIVDAREFNARFVQPLLPEDGLEPCKYLLASQCHPAVFEAVPKAQVHMWHTGHDHIKDIMDFQFGEDWFTVFGGSTVLLRAIPLMRLVGYKRMHIFGADSCLVGDSHHAYSQPENDGQHLAPVSVGDRMFICHPWMVAQAAEFQELVKAYLDEIELEVYGDGLLAYILKHAAEKTDFL